MTFDVKEAVAAARAVRELDNATLTRELRLLLWDIGASYCNSRHTSHDWLTVKDLRTLHDRLWFYVDFHRDERAAQAARDVREHCLLIARERPATRAVRALARRAAFIAAEVALRFPALRPRRRAQPSGDADATL